MKSLHAFRKNQTASAKNPISNAPMADGANTSNGVRRVLGFSLHGWENLMISFLVVAGFFALIAGVSTWIVVKLQRIEIASSKDEFERYKLNADRDISEAKAEASKAQLALEKFKAPRVLTGEQLHAFADKLRPLAGQAYDLSLPMMMEPGAGLHTQLLGALHMAGWKLQSVRTAGRRRLLSPVEVMFAVDMPKGPGTFPLPTDRIEVGISDGVIGILIGFEAGDALAAPVALLDAFKAVGMEAYLSAMFDSMAPGVNFTPKTTPSTVHIIIGSKN